MNAILIHNLSWKTVRVAWVTRELTRKWKNWADDLPNSIIHVEKAQGLELWSAHSRVCVLCRFSCVWLCDAIDWAYRSSLGILQAGILEWVAISFSRGSSQPRDQTRISYVSCTGMHSLPLGPPGKTVLLSKYFVYWGF